MILHFPEDLPKAPHTLEPPADLPGSLDVDPSAAMPGEATVIDMFSRKRLVEEKPIITLLDPNGPLPQESISEEHIAEINSRLSARQSALGQAALMPSVAPAEPWEPSVWHRRPHRSRFVQFGLSGHKPGGVATETDNPVEENVSILSAAGYYAAQGASYLAKKSRPVAAHAVDKLKSEVKSGFEGWRTSEPGLVRSLGNRALFGAGIIARRAGERVTDTVRPAREALSDFATEFIDNEAQFSKSEKLSALASSRRAKAEVRRSKPKALASIDRQVERLKNRSDRLRDTAIRGSGNLGPLRTDTRVSMHARSDRIRGRAVTLEKEATLRHERAPKSLAPPPANLSTRAPGQS